MLSFHSLLPAAPEILLGIATMAILIFDLFVPHSKRWITCLLSILAAGAVACISGAYFVEHMNQRVFMDMFVADPMANLLKCAAGVVMVFTLFYGRRYVEAHRMTRGELGGEFYVLALFSLLGQMIIMSGNHLLVLYLGVELMSLPLYALIALKRHNRQAVEAAMKYFVLGALGSGLMLYGISLVYGATGSLHLSDIMASLTHVMPDNSFLILATVFVLAGLAFKLGAVPFHMWVPDVYEGAPTAVTLLIGGVSKLAVFALCYRLLAEGLLPLAMQWQPILMLLAVLSMGLGNITALKQTNLKRMLAYSAIAQMGFMLLGLLSGVVSGVWQAYAPEAWSASLFYVMAYVLAVTGAFGVILLLSTSGREMDTLAAFRGLHRRQPAMAAMMLVFMLSLAGIPPLMGFYAKLSVLLAVVEAGHFWLAACAIVFSVIGAYYYLRIVKLMYFDEPENTESYYIPLNLRILLGINALAVLLLGILPGGFFNLCMRATGIV